MDKEYTDDYELLYLVSENNEYASDEIFKKYESVVDYYAKMYCPFVEGKGIDYNDLYQEGLIGLDSAIRSYKDQKDIKFSTFVFICVKRKILTAVKAVNRKKHSILNESYSIDYHNEDDDKLGFENIVYENKGGIEDILVGKEDLDHFNLLINERLTNMEKQIYDLKVNDFSNDEIANNLNKTIKAVESALFRIRVKLKDIINEIN